MTTSNATTEGVERNQTRYSPFLSTYARSASNKISWFEAADRDVDLLPTVQQQDAPVERHMSVASQSVRIDISEDQQLRTVQDPPSEFVAASEDQHVTAVQEAPIEFVDDPANLHDVAAPQEAPSAFVDTVTAQHGVAVVQEPPSENIEITRHQDPFHDAVSSVPALGVTSYRQAQTWEEVEALLRMAQNLSRNEGTYDPFFANQDHQHDGLRFDINGPQPGMPAETMEPNVEHERHQVTAEVQVDLNPNQHSSHAHDMTSSAILQDLAEEETLGNDPHLPAEAIDRSSHEAERRLVDDPVHVEVDTLVLTPSATAVEIMLKLSDLPRWSGAQPFFLVPCSDPLSMVIAPLEFDTATLRKGAPVWITFKNLSPMTQYCIELSDTVKATKFPSGWSFLTPARSEL